MVREADEHIEEVPASHKKNAQRYMVIGAIAVIILLIGMLVISSSRKHSKQFDAAQAAEAKERAKMEQNAMQKPKETDADKLADDINARRQALLNKVAEAEAAGQLPTDPKTQEAIEKLKNGRPVSGLHGAPPATNSGERDPVQQWQLKEKLRALDSNHRPYALVDADARGGRGAAATRAQFASLDDGTQIDPNASLSEQQRQVKQKLAEVQQLKARLSGANGDAGAITDILASRGGASKAAAPTEMISGFTASRAEQYGDSIEGKTLLPTGTVISAVLAQQVISDYAGSFKGTITHDVYDADYEKILVPKGTSVIGKIMRIKNINEPIQARMGMVVTWFVLPNGKRIDMNKKGSAEDAAGVGALAGDVNYHFMAQFLGVAAYALLVSETAQTTSSQFTGQVDVGGDISRSMAEQFSPLAQRYLTLVPTITLPAGTPFKVFVEDDVYLQPWASIYDKLISAH